MTYEEMKEATLIVLTAHRDSLPAGAEKTLATAWIDYRNGPLKAYGQDIVSKAKSGWTNGLDTPPPPPTP